MSRGIIIVGERINATRKRMSKAVASRDEAHVRREARMQVEAGADFIDVNAGRGVGDEADDLAWLVRVVQSEVEKPLCLDSADPKALAAALPAVKQPPLVNSINGDPARIEVILPLVASHGASVVALAMSETKMPETVADRMAICEELAKAVADAGVEMSRVYFDPCVISAGTSPDQPAIVLEATREIAKTWPEAHVISGLSNVSFGLPLRRLMNRTFLAMMIAAGADAFIVDPTDPGIRSTIAAAKVVRGLDEYAMGYITASREGSIG